MSVNLENEINDMSDRLKSDLSVITAKRSEDGEKNKSDLKLLANNFYQCFVNHSVCGAINIHQIDKNNFFESFI